MSAPHGLERTMTSWDGTRLFYRAWVPPQPSGKAVLLLHRGHEHSARWVDVVGELGLDDVNVFAWDARGHGKSDGERGAAPDFAALVSDLESFVAHVVSEYGIHREDMILLGHSVAAVVLAAWVHDYAPPIRGMILATPAFRIRLYVPAAIPLLRARQRLLGPGIVRSYVKPGMLTHDQSQAARYAADPLIFRQIAVNVLVDLHDTSTRIVADAAAIRVPTLVLRAGEDWVVDNHPTKLFFDRLAARTKTLRVYPGLRHAIFHELERAEAVTDVRAFIHERFSTPGDGQLPTPLDGDVHTVAEHARLSSPGGARYLPVRWALRTVGQLSDGVRLGWRSGFDSGQALDYVYENQPRGATPIGRLIDRMYLNSIGWRGIRQRRAHVEQVLRESIAWLHADGRAVHIVDIASGPGRYVLEAARSAPCPVTVRLRDANGANVETARRLAQVLGVPDVRCEEGDAFDRVSLGALRPRPTIAVACGLYELYPHNARVIESLRGLADALEPGAFLVYTNQPWHPQIEFIARVLTNRHAEPWIMRRRPQVEMDGLVRSAGFRKLAMRIDRWGMFSVSLACRV